MPADTNVIDPKTTTDLLAAYGVPVPAEAIVASADAAVEAAARIGFPVVLKVASELIPHKTEMGGILLGVKDEAAVRAGFDLLAVRTRAHLGDRLPADQPAEVLVQQQVVDGVEMIAGIVVDEQFGPFVLIGSGGVLAELLKDTVLLPAPTTPGEVLRAIDGLRAKDLLAGFRGAPPADKAAFADVVTSLSRLAADHADVLAEMDLNPVLVRPEGKGVVAVDALVVTRSS